MVKRKCGTCRFFQDGGIAGSGWCNHPARRELHHMVLVRKTELGCRNNWDQDLWELAPELAGEGEQSDIHIPDPQHIGATADGSPPSARHGDMFTDRLTSITVAPPRESASQSARNTDDFEPPAERSDVRAARRRRVEQLERERHEQQRERADEARKLLEPDPEPKPKTEASRAQTGEPKREVPPAPERRSTMPRPSQAQRQNPPPQRPAPTRQPALPRTPSAPQSRPSYDAVSHDASISFGASPGSFERTSQPSIWKPRPAPQPPVMRPAPTPAPESQRSMMQQETDDLPVQQVRALEAGAQERRPQASARPAMADHEVRAERPSREAQIEPPIEDRDPGWMVWAGQIEGPRTRKSRPAPSQPARAAERPQTVPESMAVTPPVAPPARQRPQQVPRCCATCRDFRPIGDGTTGWCINAYAPTSQRVVESGDLACDSSIGSWWLPNDVIWLERADTTHHSRPTPLLDELFRTSSDPESDEPTYPG